MVRIPFKKRSFSPREQLEKLRTRGLIVGDEALALSYLQFVGGFRLKGYYYHLLDPATKRFPDAYTFEQLVERYEFDRALRFHTFTVITRLETAIRTTISNHLSQTYGPHWFLNHEIFNHNDSWSIGKLLRKIEEEVGRSKARTFIAHYRSHFNEPYLPPSWGVTECVTFGMWSLTYASLAETSDKKSIASRFKVQKPDVFATWLHGITLLRNVSAHHSRILRHKFVAGPQNLKERNLKFDDAHTFYAVATVMSYMLGATHLPNTWKKDLKETFEKYPGVEIKEIGFNSDWDNSTGWQ